MSRDQTQHSQRATENTIVVTDTEGLLDSPSPSSKGESQESSTGKPISTSDILIQKDDVSQSEQTGKIRWYFVKNVRFGARYIAQEEPAPPITLARNETISIWDTTGIEPGVYTIMLGLSLQDVDLEAFESLQIYWRAWSANVVDVVRKADLQAQDDQHFIRLQLKQQCKIEELTPLVFDLESRFQDDGVFRLVYIELSRNGFMPSEVDRLCSWPAIPRQTINVRDAPSKEGSPGMPCSIMSYSVSSCGSYLATLAFAGTKARIDLWGLGALEPSKGEFPCDTRLCAQGELDCALDLSDINNGFYIALSYNGSQAAIFPGQDEHDFLKFSLINYSPFMSTDQIQAASPHYTRKLKKSTRHGKHKGLVDFIGSAKFLGFGDGKPAEETERFFTCDGAKANVYNTFQDWTHLFTINLTTFNRDLSPVEKRRRFKQAKHAVSTARSNLFVWDFHLQDHCIWNLETRSIQAFFPLTASGEKTASISANERVIAVSQANSITVHDTVSGLQLSPSLPISAPSAFTLSASEETWLVSDLVQRKAFSSLEHAESSSLVKDIYSLNTIGTLFQTKESAVHTVGCGDHEGVQEHLLPDNTTFLSLHQGSTVDLFRTEDLISFHNNLKGTDCPQDCDLLTTLERKKHVDDIINGIAYKTQSENVGLMPESKLIVTMEAPDRAPLPIFSAIVIDFYFLPQQCQLLTGQNKIYYLWSLPRSMDQTHELLSAWSFSELTCGTSTIKTCVHQRQIEIFRGTSETLNTSVAEVFTRKTSKPFLDALPILVRNYADINYVEMKAAILRYVVSYINKFPKQDDHSCSVMSKLCNSWEVKLHDEYLVFIQALLKTSRWIPRTSYSKNSNPICILIEKSRTQSKALELVKILISYSIDRAAKEQHVAYLTFLIECIGYLESTHPDLVLQITRAFTYVPVSSRQFVIDNHRITHEPFSHERWKTQDTTILHLQRNPILELRFNTGNRDPLTDNFTEDVFVAPLDLLWQTPKTQSGSRSRSSKPSWLSSLFYFILFHFKPATQVFVRPRLYNLEVLDNPAIHSAVQYKWNKFAFGLWLSRFTFLFVYYILIIFAALWQAYSDTPESILGIFVSIIVLGCIFLWLEYVEWRQTSYTASSSTESKENEADPQPNTPQSKAVQGPEGQPQSSFWQKEPPGYFESPYNYLDLLAFLFPIGASIHHLTRIILIEDGPTWDLSISIIVIFLHMVAELRVNPAICKYVTIVLRSLVEIRAFFGIFAVGIFFFTIAIQHTLRGCVVKDCTRYETEFPVHFFSALTAVYFMMGGRYDPITANLDKDTEFNVHIISMFYFLFTVIVMLNVLIALVNVAFIKGDDTWRQVWLENRLRYVEVAENISYHIPGFRENYDWFPKEIYYTATQEQVEKYWEKIEDSRVDSGNYLNKYKEEGDPRISSNDNLEEKLTQVETQIQQYRDESKQQGDAFNRRLDQSQQSLESQFQTIVESQRSLNNRYEAIVESQNELRTDIRELLKLMRMSKEE